MYTCLISGLCKNAQLTQENVCIVEVGKATRVLVHKTNNRDKLLSCLGKTNNIFTGLQ